MFYIYIVTMFRLVLSWDWSSGSFIFLKDKGVSCDGGIRRVLGMMGIYIVRISGGCRENLGRWLYSLSLYIYIYTFIGFCCFFFWFVRSLY